MSSASQRSLRQLWGQRGDPTRPRRRAVAVGFPPVQTLRPRDGKASQGCLVSEDTGGLCLRCPRVSRAPPAFSMSSGDRAARGLGTTPPVVPRAGRFVFLLGAVCGSVHYSHLCGAQGAREMRPPQVAGVPWPSLSLSRVHASRPPPRPPPQGTCLPRACMPSLCTQMCGGEA